MDTHPIDKILIETFTGGTFSVRVTCTRCGHVVERKEQTGSRVAVHGELLEELGNLPCTGPVSAAT